MNVTTPWVFAGARIVHLTPAILHLSLFECLFTGKNRQMNTLCSLKLDLQKQLSLSVFNAETVKKRTIHHKKRIVHTTHKLPTSGTVFAQSTEGCLGTLSI